MTKVSDIFDVRYGHSLELNRLKIVNPSDGVAFVSRKMGDNGISAYVATIPDLDPAPAGDISCALGGNGVLTTHLQEQPFYVGRDVALLRPLMALSKAQILFYCLCIKANRFRYSYGRQANRTLRDIIVPDIESLPLWVNEFNVEMYAGADKPGSSDDIPALSTDRWKPFMLGSLFDLKKGRRLTKANMVRGDIPFIGAIDFKQRGFQLRCMRHS